MVGHGPCSDEQLQKTHRCGKITLDVLASRVAGSLPSVLSSLVPLLQTGVTSEGKRCPIKLDQNV